MRAIAWRADLVKNVGSLVADIGYGIRKRFYKLGYGTLFVQRLVEKIFHETDLYMIKAYLAEENVASGRILTKWNFEQQGFLRERYLIQGQRVNEMLYDLIRRKFMVKQKMIAVVNFFW